uniref:Uncharacterized protein n=1 Tax=Coccidioides posadasii RMSCC 3488 TaxID=454284 RepID=A0A0J6I9T2_COCPO|nr:hypothetical protein CPAG_04686 [Coccidioides posadasii RMSCC 3488]
MGFWGEDDRWEGLAKTSGSSAKGARLDGLPSLLVLGEGPGSRSLTAKFFDLKRRDYIDPVFAFVLRGYYLVSLHVGFDPILVHRDLSFGKEADINVAGREMKRT